MMIYYSNDVKYKVHFNLKIDEVKDIQKLILEQLDTRYHCIYTFIEESHHETVTSSTIPVYSHSKVEIVRYYTVIALYTMQPMTKLELFKYLDKIPNNEPRRKIK